MKRANRYVRTDEPTLFIENYSADTTYCSVSQLLSYQLFMQIASSFKIPRVWNRKSAKISKAYINLMPL